MNGEAALSSRGVVSAAGADSLSHHRRYTSNARSSSRRGRGRAHPGSSSRVPAGGASTRGAEGAGNGVRREEGMTTIFGWAGLGGGGIKGALVWTAAASMTIALSRWVGG